MNISPLSPDYAVSPQICPSDMGDIAAAGYKTIICNRPDGECHPADQCAQIQVAAEQAGLQFAENPFDQMTFGLDVIQKQASLLNDMPGPVLAYCASGTRSAMLWAMAQAGSRPVADILADTRTQGFALDHLAPMLNSLAQG